MSRRRFVVAALLAALAVSALTPLTSGLAGMLIYSTAGWLPRVLFGSLDPGELFVQAYVMGLLWPWLAAALVILMRQIEAGVKQSAPGRIGLYLAVIYIATLLLAVALSLG